MTPSGVHVSEQPEASFLVMFLNVTNTITHLCLGAAAGVAFFIANLIKPLTNMSTHIFLCTFGYVILLAVGFLAFDPSSNLRRSLQYPKKKLSHLVLQVVGSVLAIAGTLFAIGSHPLPESFSTTHGIMGLVSLILAALSLIGGFINFCSSEKNNRAMITTLHTCLGTLTIIMAFVTLCLGFENLLGLLGVLGLNDSNKRFSIAVTSIGLIGFVIPPVVNTFFRLQN